jgi:hypothetical protein
MRTEDLKYDEKELDQDLGRIDFGKHNGTRWDRLPINYLWYLSSEDCLTSDENKRKAKIAMWQVTQRQKKEEASQYKLF